MSLLDKYHYMVDVRSVLTLFGGVTATANILRGTGCQISTKTVEKWQERKRMPADALACLTVYALKEGIPFNIADHIEVRNEKERSGLGA